MRRGNLLIAMPFLLMLLFASCQQFGFGSERQPIPAVILHDDGIRTEYHDFISFGNG